MTRLRFYSNCVDWPENDVHKPGGLCDMVNAAIGITRRTLLEHVSKEDMHRLEQQLGYSRCKDDGMMMADDWHVSYHRSVLHGRRVYFFKHSAIEYVFTGANDGPL